jgi:hypothetical protein
LHGKDKGGGENQSDHGSGFSFGGPGIDIRIISAIISDLGWARRPKSTIIMVNLPSIVKDALLKT